MWNQSTDELFLSMRDDAVFIFQKDNMTLLCLNPAAQKLIPEAQVGGAYADLFHDAAIDRVLTQSNTTGRMAVLPLEHVSWFPENAVLHALPLQWSGISAVALTIDRRAYGPPPEALQMMKAVLTSAYFTSLRVDLETMRASVISDKNPLMNTQAKFPSFLDYIARYAEAVIHPEDREQFLAAFSVEQLHLFLEANTTPTCTVRRLSDEEYRWASFSLAVVNANIVLLLGKDSNEQHLQQERSDRYQSELAALSLRNSYILSSISDIFRLMLHIDLKSGKTVLCAIHSDLKPYFAFDKVYQFDDISAELLRHVHPEDRPALQEFATLTRLHQLAAESEDRLSFEYRRIAPQQDPDVNPRWTRSVFTFVQYEGKMPTEAIYAVQDIDAQKQKELEAKRKRDALTNQFHTLIQNRFIWFIECNYQKQIARCYKISNHLIMSPMECPFGQFFERIIMPHCHPEDYKRVAKTLLPRAAEEAFRNGKHQLTVDYRIRTESGWRYARAEVYMQEDNGVLRAMTYIADIDDEVRSRDELNRAEHEQLVLRRKFGMMIEDSFRKVIEVDLDSDSLYHYEIRNKEYQPVRDEMPFSRYSEEFSTRYIHPDQRKQFESLFSYEQILIAARSRKEQIKHLFLVDLDENGTYIWCNICLRFFSDENGKAYIMSYVEDVNDEICKRDSQLHELTETKAQLQQNIREKERSRIRKAHVFLNIASSFQLSLNQIYATLYRLEHDMPQKMDDKAEVRKAFRSMFTAYEHLSAMTECAKDMLLLENNQLPLILEPVSLPDLFKKLKQDTAQMFGEKSLKIATYTSHVTQEHILCDRQRLTYLIDNIFVNVIRSLPFGSSVTLQLSQAAIPGAERKAMYEFSLITSGDRVSQDIQSGMLSPIPDDDPLKSIEDTLMLNQSGFEQHNLYLSKRLIALMNGTLEFVKLPAHATAIMLRLPFEYIPQQVVFPLRLTFGKSALVWDSNQTTAGATMEMLRETGMQLDWQPDFDHVCAYLSLLEKQNKTCELLMLRQSDLNRQSGEPLTKLHALAPKTPIIVIGDAPKSHGGAKANDAIYLKTPVFRSGLAEKMRTIFREN